MASNDGMHIYLDSVKEENGEIMVARMLTRFFIKEMELSKRAKEKGEERETQMDEIFEHEYEKIKGYLNIDEIISNDLNPTIKPFFFHVPKTLEAWKEELKKAKTEPAEGIHYKIDRGIVYANAAYVTGKKGTIEKLEDDLWEILEKNTENDSRIEDTLLRYADKDRQRPEWSITLENFKKYGEKHGYGEEHFKLTLDRWISWFEPSLQTVTNEMKAEDIAKLLLSMYKPTDKFTTLRRELMNMTRKPGEDLNCKLSLVKALSEAMYANYSAVEKTVNVEKIMLTALIQFTSGNTRTNAEKTMEFLRREGRPIKFDQFLEAAMRSERIFGTPTETLHYNAPAKGLTMYNVDTTIPKLVRGQKGPPPLVHDNVLPESFSQVYPDTIDYRTIAPPNIRSKPSVLGLKPTFKSTLRKPTVDLTTKTSVSSESSEEANSPNNTYREEKYFDQDLIEGNDDQIFDFFDGKPMTTNSRTIKNTDVDLQNQKQDTQAQIHSTPEKQQEENLEEFATPGVDPNVQSKNLTSRSNDVVRRKSDRETRPPDRYNPGANHINVGLNHSVTDPVLMHILNNYNLSPKNDTNFRKPTPTRNNSRSPSRNYKDNMSKNQDNRGRTGYDNRYRARSQENRPSSGNYNRTDSRNRSPYQNNNFRSNSNSNKKSYNYTRSPSGRNDQNRSRENSPKYRQSYSPDRSSGSDSNRNRNRSPAKPLKPFNKEDMKKGENCSLNYDPWKELRCLKCLTENSHHEFECRKYNKRSKFNCSNCYQGFHFPSECQKGGGESRNRSLSENRKN